MPSEKAVVLSSGGLNSAVLTSLARRDHEVALLHVRFGHRAAEREAELFEKQAAHFEIAHKLVIDMPHFAVIGGNARTSRKRQIEDALAIGEGEANTYVAGLVGAMISAAFSWAHTLAAAKVFIGISEDLGPPAPKTSLMYPDFSREYLQLCNHLFDVASPARPIALEAPLADLNRTDIVRLGHRLETPLELTWSCLSSGTQLCGACAGCATRARGFLSAGLPDPIFPQPAMR
jgi:7-cyano-7-deazaguanine synthase